MADQNKGALAAGFGLLWRRQTILWWVFAVNFLCAAFATLPALLLLSRSIGHSLAAQKLSNGFDLGIFVELFRLPAVSLQRPAATSYLLALLFLLFMMFVSGGILETYRQDRRLTTSEFFAASGLFFWRFVRLALLSIVPFVIVSMIYQGLSKAAEKIGDRAIADQVGIFLGWAAIIVFLLLALSVRLWFDIAKIRAVAQNERGMWRNTWRSWRMVWHGFGSLFGMYVAISLLAWVVTLLGLVIWAHLPPTALPLTFIILEFIVFAQLMTRLWQLASATAWYERRAEVAVTGSVYAMPEPVVEPEQASPMDAGPELPPADA